MTAQRDHSVGHELTMLLGLGAKWGHEEGWKREESWQPTPYPPPHLFTEDQAATHWLLQGPPPSLPPVGGNSREDQSPEVGSRSRG